mmetsp:Transcript_24029/g.35468  ORF Transcript_24029/g.35468 Transcript_24029/m.35468 type:complete len:80 (-) Transcript_24029:621-860(-)
MKQTYMSASSSSTDMGTHGDEVKLLGTSSSTETRLILLGTMSKSFNQCHGQRAYGCIVFVSQVMLKLRRCGAKEKIPRK